MSVTDRLQIFNTLRGLTAEDFNKLVFALNPPSGLMPGTNAPQSDRTRALLEWAESPTGRGLTEVSELLDHLDSLPSPAGVEPLAIDLGPNPYKGLMAFEEEDCDRFFGRDDLIEELCQRFSSLHQTPQAVRILPIYGPSGSGKSSLAKAGLVPALRKHPLPGKTDPAVLTVQPGSRPLRELANALARLAPEGTVPITTRQDFQDALGRPNDKQDFEGLYSIADYVVGQSSYLILLIDQFEEVYTLCEDLQERHAFIENLLCAASDPNPLVSVILTMRSDFLGATQQQPKLNGLFSYPGKLISVIQPGELEKVITEPAKLALAQCSREAKQWGGELLNEFFVQDLVKETVGQEGALPLLQFVLAQIWEGMNKGVKPFDTLDRIGGVGGALANEAKGIYDSLFPEEQQTARSIFLRLIKVNDDKTATRRRVPISELTANEPGACLVKTVINRFTKPGVWILVTFATEEEIEMVEVAHEALIQNWEDLREWLKDQWEVLRQRDKIEQAAQEWQEKQRSKDYLLQGRSLRDVKEFLEFHKYESDIAISSLALEFLKAGMKSQKIRFLKMAGIFLVFPLIGTSFVTPEILNLIQSRNIDRAKEILYKDDCEPNPSTRDAIEYLKNQGYGYELSGIKLCGENIPNIDLAGTDLSDGDLRKANLGGANLQNAFLIRADIEGAKLIDANLNRAILQAAKMRGTQLQVSDLREADLSDADLQKAGLEGADLSNADLSNANLSGANLEDAVLSGTNLQNADLRDVSNLSYEQLAEAKTVCNIRLSEDLLYKDSQIKKLAINCN